MKVPCGGFDLDESVFNVDKNSKQLKLNSPISYDYMPDGYPKKDGWSIEWDGNTEGLTHIRIEEENHDLYKILYKISDFLPTDDELIGAILEASNGSSLKISSDKINSSAYPEITVVVDAIYVVRQDNSIFQGIALPEKGVYTFYENGRYVKKISKESITPMAGEFLPSVVNELIMNSSTPDSTKKFKITVNDSGAITATEVT